MEYSHSLFVVGSCFASAIGSRLAESKFTTCVNPFGVLFNPLSIRSTFDRLERAQSVAPSELQSGNGLYFHYDFHGSFSDVSSVVALAKMNDAVAEGAQALANATTVIITLGTTWVYELTESGAVVANCHKVPSAKFKRWAMSTAQVVDALVPLVERYADKRFIFTVSPVRHLADGFEDNSLSKATLRVAIAELVARYANAQYFPSFEIVMDDLRDYRFYGEDMAHLSEQAEEYVWLKFREAAISPATNLRIAEVQRIQKAATHRPFNPASDEHKAFCRKQLLSIAQLADLDFSAEREYFENQIK